MCPCVVSPAAIRPILLVMTKHKKGSGNEAFRRQGRQAAGAIAYFPLKAVAAGTFTAILLVLVVPAHLPAPGAPGCPGLGKTLFDGYCRLP